MAARPSPRPVRPSPSVVVADTLTGAATARGQHRLRVAPARADPGRLADQLDRDVADRPARGGHQDRGLGEQGDAGRAGPPRVRGAEDRAEVAEAGRGQQRVAGGVRGDVAVGVAGAAVRARPLQAGQPAPAARLDRVHVDADAYPHAGILPGRVTGAQSPGRRQRGVGAAATVGAWVPRPPSCSPAAPAAGSARTATRSICRSPGGRCCPGRWPPSRPPVRTAGWCSSPGPADRQLAGTPSTASAARGWRSSTAARPGTARSGRRCGTSRRRSGPASWTWSPSTTAPGRWPAAELIERHHGRGPRARRRRPRRTAGGRRHRADPSAAVRHEPADGGWSGCRRRRRSGRAAAGRVRAGGPGRLHRHRHRRLRRAVRRAARALPARRPAQPQGDLPRT